MRFILWQCRLWLAVLVMFLPKDTLAKYTETNKKANHYYANSFKQLIGTFYIRQSPGLRMPVKQIGFYYERKAYRDFYIGAGYLQWEALRIFTRSEEMFVNERPILQSYRYDPVPGRLEYRQEYKMLDGYIFYKHKIAPKHYLNGGIGLTYCWGEDVYLKYLRRISFFESEIRYTTVKAEYWGVMPLLSYDYLLFKGCMNVGVDVRGRYYSGRPKAQYDLLVHIGFNF